MSKSPPSKLKKIASALALGAAIISHDVSPQVARAFTEAAVPLYEYQVKWIQDKSRFKIGMFARQTGKTFTTTLEIVDSIFEGMANGRVVEWVILSRGQRQSKEAIKWVKRHAQAYNMAVQDIEDEFVPEGKKDKYTQLEIVFANGSRVIALPANPDTARGYTANVYLDEFAIHQDSREIYGALFFLISAGYKIRITSTPKGKANKFAEIWHQKIGTWSRHSCDIYQAVAQGLQRDIQELKDNLNDQELWEQEAELKFVDEAGMWLSHDLISNCGHVLASEPSGYLGNECSIGVDIGRKHDRFVIQVLERVGDVWWHREQVVLHKKTFAEQELALADVFKRYRVTRCYMDETGLGAMPVERAQTKHGSCVLGIVFSQQSKLRMATASKKMFESQRLRLSPGEDDLRTDLLKIKKEVNGENVKLSADTDESGHADRAWAFFLACMGTDGPERLPFDFTPIPARHDRAATNAADDDSTNDWWNGRERSGY